MLSTRLRQHARFHRDRRDEIALYEAADVIDQLLEVAKILAGIPVEDFGKENKPKYPLQAWNGYEIRVEHVLAARAAIAKATGEA